jgi:hypothetical protein
MLAEHRLRYVIVGGLALVLHGVDRLTADVDLAVDLAPDQAGRMVDVLIGSGFRSAVPVDPMHLADPAVRGQWQRDRNMVVFSFWDSTGNRPTIDIFLSPPVPFEDLWRDAVQIEIASDLKVNVASIAHLIRLKEIAGRAQDLSDIQRLREL